MNRQSTIIHILFLALSIIHLGCLYVGDYMVGGVTKALLLPTLAYFFYLKTKSELDAPRKLVITGFIFSWVGDVTLMMADAHDDVFFINENFFYLGLVAFLIAHIMYIRAFLKEVRLFDPPYMSSQLPMMALPIVVTCVGLLVVLVPSITKNYDAVLAIAVTAYAITITTMVISAANRKGRVSNFSFWMVVEGATIFMLSDSMIALSKFTPYMDGLSHVTIRLLIMFTYILAQYMIAWGMIRRNN